MMTSAMNGLASGSSGSTCVTAGQQLLIICLTILVFSGNNPGFIASPKMDPPVWTCECGAEMGRSDEGVRHQEGKNHDTTLSRWSTYHPFRQNLWIASQWIEFHLLADDSASMRFVGRNADTVASFLQLVGKSHKRKNIAVCPTNKDANGHIVRKRQGPGSREVGADSSFEVLAGGRDLLDHSFGNVGIHELSCNLSDSYKMCCRCRHLRLSCVGHFLSLFARFESVTHYQVLTR
jgi:hypothetical protein